MREGPKIAPSAKWFWVVDLIRIVETVLGLAAARRVALAFGGELEYFLTGACQEESA